MLTINGKTIKNIAEFSELLEAKTVISVTTNQEELFNRLNEKSEQIKALCDLIQATAVSGQTPALLGLLYRDILEYHMEIDKLDVALSNDVQEGCSYAKPYIQIANDASEFLRAASSDFLDVRREEAEIKKRSV